MGGIISVITGVFFDPPIDSKQVLALTASLGAPGQNCLRAKSDQTQSNSAPVIEKQPAPMVELLQPLKTEDLPQSEITRVAQQILSSDTAASGTSWDKKRTVPWGEVMVTTDQHSEQRTMNAALNTHPVKTGKLTRTKTTCNLEEMGKKSEFPQDVTSQVQTKDSTSKQSNTQEIAIALLRKREDFLNNNVATHRVSRRSYVPFRKSFYLEVIEDE